MLNVDTYLYVCIYVCIYTHSTLLVLVPILIPAPVEVIRLLGVAE